MISISPHYTSDQFQDHWTLDDKIKVFIDRVEGWQLGIANEIVKRDIPYRDIAILDIVSSFFEIISKYNSGFIGEGKSKEHFKKGFRLTFSGFELDSKKFLDSLYIYIRNGLYHVGRPSPNIIIVRNSPGSIGYYEEHDMIMVSPDQLVNDISTFFATYGKELRNPQNKTIRNNFEKRFDYDNSIHVSG